MTSQFLTEMRHCSPCCPPRPACLDGHDDASASMDLPAPTSRPERAKFGITLIYEIKLGKKIEKQPTTNSVTNQQITLTHQIILGARLHLSQLQNPSQSQFILLHPAQPSPSCSRHNPQQYKISKYFDLSILHHDKQQNTTDEQWGGMEGRHRLQNKHNSSIPFPAMPKKQQHMHRATLI